jgi:D-alanyl-D-alanine dipeptidase
LSTARAQEPALVNLKSIDPTIVVELRYAGHNNVSGAPLYPPGMPALLRPEVAQRVAKAQAELRARGFGLKIWDAYRPKAAHEQLWSTGPITITSRAPSKADRFTRAASPSMRRW